MRITPERNTQKISDYSCVMGKKRPQKTKELSVAIAEASSIADIEQTQQQQHHHHQEEQQAQAQAQTPRKRGRPRKIINIVETSDRISSEEEKKFGDNSQVSGKKVKINIEGKVKEEGSSTAMEGHDVDDDEKEESGQSRRRSRRKSKPRKSS